jgi:hypothetical protein
MPDIIITKMSRAVYSGLEFEDYWVVGDGVGGRSVSVLVFDFYKLCYYFFKGYGVGFW